MNNPKFLAIKRCFYHILSVMNNPGHLALLGYKNISVTSNDREKTYKNLYF